MATQGPNGLQPPPNRGGNNFSNMNVNTSMGRSSFADDGISIREANIGVPGFEPPQPAQRSSKRPDMKGPSDISDILSGLKTKTIDITVGNGNRTTNSQTSMAIDDLNNNSTISIDDLKSIQSEANIPKKSKRRQTSNKNTVSLDI